MPLIADTYKTGGLVAQKLFSSLNAGMKNKKELELEIISDLLKAGLKCVTRKNVSITMTFLKANNFIEQDGSAIKLTSEGESCAKGVMDLSLLYREWVHERQRISRNNRKNKKKNSKSRKKETPKKTPDDTKQNGETEKVTIEVNHTKVTGSYEDLRLLLRVKK